MFKMLLRIKKYFVAWGAIFFCILCLSLYLMLENIMMNSSRNAVLDESAIDSIEHKIQLIEKDMESNRKTIHDIKISIHEMIKGNYSLLNLPISFENSPVRPSDLHKFPKKNIILPFDTCKWANKPPATSDINIMELYETLPFDNVDGGVWKQGYDIAYSMDQWKRKKLRVYVVPHTHCDPGWIKTYDKYFSDDVRPILNLMVSKLKEDPRRRFIYAEMSFFSRWWKEVSEDVRNNVKGLIENGQLELVTGGWVMNDEALSHYSSIVDQLLEGHLWINTTFGLKPSSHWTIDPFGYSATNSYLIEQTGITSMLIQRVHYEVKKQLARNRQLEFMWRQQWDHLGSSDIFTHMMPFYSYDIPHTCGPNPKICCQFDFARLPGSKLRCPWSVNPVNITTSNVAERATTLLDQYRKKATLYRSNVVLIPIGDDFRYSIAQEWDQQFLNYQKLFDYMNEHEDLRVEAKFGTLSEYFNAVHEEMGVRRGEKVPEVPVLTGDFFSYNDRGDHYWTGFFTSRPFYKRLNREVEHHLRAAEIALSLALSYARRHKAKEVDTHDLISRMTNSREALSLFQHHDGITGTARDFVVVDYGKRLVNALMDMKAVITECVYFLMHTSRTNYRRSSARVLYFDEIRSSHDALPQPTVIEPLDKPISLLVYNSLAQERTGVVTVHVNTSSVTITDPYGSPVLSQYHPVWDQPEQPSIKTFKVSFVATVPALGVATYTITRVPRTFNSRSKASSINLMNSVENSAKSKHFDITKVEAADFEISNSYLKASFTKDGLLQAVSEMTSFAGKRSMKLSFVYYGVKVQKERSGAYLFLPDGPASPLQFKKPLVRVITGPVLSEVHVGLPYVHHVARIVNSPGVDGAVIDIQNMVDIRSQHNFELAMRLDTDIDNADRIFYTDQNGFQMQKRKTFDKLPLQGNFYPMTTNSILEDRESRLNVISGQSCGVASLATGQIEMMLDRRLKQDDNRGLGQPVVDNKLTPNLFRLLLERKDRTASMKSHVLYPSLASHWSVHELIHPMFVFARNNKALSSPLMKVFRPLSRSLPCQLHLLNLRTLQNTRDTALMLRSLGFDCASQLTGLDCTVTDDEKLDLNSLFRDLNVTSVRETSLTLLHTKSAPPSAATVTIPPMHLRTFQLRLL